MSAKSKSWLFPVVAITAAVVAAMSQDHVWVVAAALLAGGTFAAYLIVEAILPAIRKHRLKHPCEVHFNVIGRHEGEITYAIQDDRTHHVDELVLPANSEIPIEIIYLPKLPFYETKLAFGCEGNIEGKPYATECFSRFNLKGKSQWIPGVDDGHYLTRHKFYQMDREQHRNTGTHRVVGFKLKTENVGVFDARVYFMTDEVEGSAKLTIRVEEKPKTTVRCIIKDHWDCYVYPNTH
jgi:hypothetical protein